MKLAPVFLGSLAKRRAATLFSFILTNLGITKVIASFILGISTTPWVVLVIINVVLLILGMIMEPGAILIMMLLAFILSLCSEADAFIGASLLSIFGVAPTVAFLIIGPMVDIKNLIMMKHQFKTRFVGLFVGTASLVTIIYCLLLGVI